MSPMMERAETRPVRPKDPGPLEPAEPFSLRGEATRSDHTPSGWLPPPRGPLSASILGYVTGTRPRLSASEGPDGSADALGDDDLHLALYLCYELHYRGLPGVPDALECDLEVLRFRAGLERRFEQALREAVHPGPVDAGEVPGDSIRRFRPMSIAR